MFEALRTTEADLSDEPANAMSDPKAATKAAYFTEAITTIDRNIELGAAGSAADIDEQMTGH